MIFMAAVMGMASNSPMPPQSQPQNNSEINTAAVFILAILPVIQVVMTMPTKMAIMTEMDATNKASARESNCRKAAKPVTIAVKAGPI